MKIPILAAAAAGRKEPTGFGFDQGSYASFAETATPGTYRITPIEHFNNEFLWWAFRSGQFAGKTPHFVVTNTHRRVAPATTERMCVWASAADTATWYDFDNVTVGASDTEFYNNSPFPAGTIYIASLPMYNYARSARVFASWLTDARGTNLTSATLLTARASVDGRAASALPILAGMWTNASGYTKNKMVFTSGNHPDESTGRLALEGVMTWLLGGSVEAEFLLDWFEVYVYPCVNPQGVEMGYFRSSPQTAASDNNRLWDTTGTNEAVDLVKTRMAADTGGTVAVGIDFHSAAGNTSVISYFSVESGSAGIYPALDAAYDSFQAQTFVEETIPEALRNVWRLTYSAVIAASFEITGRKATTIAQMITSGQYVGAAISKMLASGQFTNNAGVGARDFNGTTDRIDWANVANLKGAAFTLSYWIYFDAVSHNSYVFCAHNASDASHGTVANSANATSLTILRATSGSSYIWDANGVGTLTGAWHHVLHTCDGGLVAGSVVTYLDGVSKNISFTAGSGAEGERTGSWSIGGRISDDARNVDGKVAQVAVWNRVLSAGEIANLAAGHAPSTIATGLLFNFAGSTSSLVASPGGTGTADGTTSVTGVGNGPTIYYP
jgi:hypothetical protein